MIKPFLALLLTGSILLTGCDMELSQEAKSKVEETKQAANALKQDANTSVEELKNNFNNELQKPKTVQLPPPCQKKPINISKVSNRKQKTLAI